MNNIRAILAAAGLVVVAGAMGTAQADNDRNSITLYTSAIRTGVIACNAVNVSRKTLTITISIIDAATGHVLNTPSPMPTYPGKPEATDDFGDPTANPPNEGYCVFHVSGTANADDVRAIQNAVAGAMHTVDGGQTFFPVWLSRVLEAH
jgi:hypothetical protein